MVDTKIAPQAHGQLCRVINVRIMQSRIGLLAQGFILLSAAAFLSVSVLAFINPQAVMDLVQVRLPNTDAYSSIRGAYGGVGLTLCISLVYLLLRDRRTGLRFLCLLWGLYALSRVLTIFIEGTLGAFGRQWLLIETTGFLIALSLLWADRRVVFTDTRLRNEGRR